MQRIQHRSKRPKTNKRVRCREQPMDQTPSFPPTTWETIRLLSSGKHVRKTTINTHYVFSTPITCVAEQTSSPLYVEIKQRLELV